MVNVEGFAHATSSRSRPRSAAKALPRRAPAPTPRRRCRSGCCLCSPGGGGMRSACTVRAWTWCALYCPGSTQVAGVRWPRRHGATLLRWVLWGATAVDPSLPPGQTLPEAPRTGPSAPTREPRDRIQRAAPGYSQGRA
eukprot:scaffold71236_cov69-Phaeocystis_antarctica.AAC.5